MSSNRCNHCSLKSIREDAKKASSTVVLQRDTEFALGGTNVYVVPKGKELNHDEHFRAWFMKITDKCAC